MDGPICVSGVYPRLAALSTGRSECGIGAVVPWAGSLWFITYPAHGGDGRLWQVDAALNLHLRPESVGGTHAGRLIHRESNQLIIGPYFIDAQGQVRACKARGRLTAVMRRLTDPANKVCYFGMEGEFCEVNVKTLEVTPLTQVQKLGVTGAHGKGGYTGQGRMVIANNGGVGGLAEGDGTAWTVLERKQFCEVTGPGGISGAPDDRSADIPVWCTGWDHRSVILKVLDHGAWHTFRLPKSSHSHDAAHGWFTEWPRIREIAPGRCLLDFHGMFFDFPSTFDAAHGAGLRGLATHLRMVPDFCAWNGRLVFASDDTSVMGNPLGGQPQSNLWFTTVEHLAELGRPSGWGGPWVADMVKAGAPSEPFLIAGFEKRVLHLAHGADAEVRFTLQIDARGDGQWRALKSVTVPAKGYVHEVLPPDLAGVWMRVTSDRDCAATAYFHFTSSGQARTPEAGRMFGSLAPVGSAEPRTEGVLLPAEGKLWFLAQPAAGAGASRLYEIDQDLRPRRCADNPENRARAARLEKTIPGTGPSAGAAGGVAVGWDDASVVIRSKDGAWRLPKGDAAYERPEFSRFRRVREVVTERSLLNAHGLFYELPRGGVAGMRPICTHNVLISDFCTWRGLLVMSGARAAAEPDGHFFAAEDKAGLWFGAVDDLWRFGKPRGVGGPWRKTAVRSGGPSDPYLMTGFDKKTLDLSHDAAEAVEFLVEVDFLKTGVWQPYAVLTVPAAQTLRHEFPDGFAAYWVRLTARRDCCATAWFSYE